MVILVHAVGDINRFQIYYLAVEMFVLSCFIIDKAVIFMRINLNQICLNFVAFKNRYDVQVSRLTTCMIALFRLTSTNCHDFFFFRFVKE